MYDDRYRTKASFPKREAPQPASEDERNSEKEIQEKYKESEDIQKSASTQADEE